LERLPLVEEPGAALDRQREPGPRREDSVDARQVANRLASRVGVLGNGASGISAITTERVAGEGEGNAVVWPPSDPRREGPGVEVFVDASALAVVGGILGRAVVRGEGEVALRAEVASEHEVVPVAVARAPRDVALARLERAVGRALRGHGRA